jgi:hypothetical protein
MPKKFIGRKTTSLTNWISTQRRLKLVPHLLSRCIKINSKLIKDLNISTKTVKLGKIQEDTDIGNNLLNGTPIAQKIRARIAKWD